MQRIGWIFVTLASTAVVRAQEGPTESHFLWFERVVLMSAPTDVRAWHFQIGAEHVRRHKVGGAVRETANVELDFKPDRQRGDWVDLPILIALVHNAEKLGDSPWRLAELAATRNDTAWRISKLEFARELGPGPAGDASGSAVGSAALSGLFAIVDQVRSRDVDLAINQLRYKRESRSGDTLLSIKVEVRGERFRSGFARLHETFRKACEDGVGPFVEVTEVGDEEVFSDREPGGATYELQLRVAQAVDAAGRETVEQAVRRRLTIFDEVERIVVAIDDDETLTAALPKLDDVLERLGDVDTRLKLLGEMPRAVRERCRPQFEARAERLRELAGSIRSDPLKDRLVALASRAEI